MDPITAAIVAALSAGAQGDLADKGKIVIVDTYNDLKVLLVEKFGDQSEVMKSIATLEARPESLSRQATLEEEIQSTKAFQDPELLHAAQTLINQIKAQPGGEGYIQSVTGGYFGQENAGGSASISQENAGGSASISTSQGFGGGGGGTGGGDEEF